MEKIGFAVGAASVALFALGTAAHAHGFGEMRGGMHRNGAIMSCVAVMTPAQRTGLKKLFGGEKGKLRSDWENVAAARRALTAAIVSDAKDVSSREAALNQAQKHFVKDKSALAFQVCGQLKPSQRSAAGTLFANLSSLRQRTHKQLRQYFEQAKAEALGSKGK